MPAAGEPEEWEEIVFQLLLLFVLGVLVVLGLWALLPN